MNVKQIFKVIPYFKIPRPAPLLYVLIISKAYSYFFRHLLLRHVSGFSCVLQILSHTPPFPAAGAPPQTQPIVTVIY